jgi:hypothetical protein
VKTIRRIGGWLSPYRGQLIVAMVMTVAACLFNLPVPLMIPEVFAIGRADESRFRL